MADSPCQGKYDLTYGLINRRGKINCSTARQSNSFNIGEGGLLFGLDPTLILVANSISDHAAGCRAAKREQRVLAVGLAVCQSAILTRLTAAAVMMCCKWVLANPI
jgi:hypothetical protein